MKDRNDNLPKEKVLELLGDTQEENLALKAWLISFITSDVSLNIDFNELVENISDMICALDTNLNVIFFNERYHNYLQARYNAKLKIGKSIFAGLGNIDESVQKEWINHYNRVLSGESYDIDSQATVRGIKKHFEIRFSPIRNKNGEISGLIFSIKDITERKKIEMQLQVQNEELRVVNEELDRFVYSASHDLRAPLSSLLGLINLTKIETNEKNKVAYLDMMEKSVHKMDKFIKEIIYHSRNTRLEISENEINFQVIIQEILDDLNFMNENHQVEKTITINQDGGFVTDEYRLNVILNNLVSNAIRYSDPGKEHANLDIIVNCNSKEAVIHIKDNGIGIALEQLPKIFDMFYRANSDSTGSGLGLYMVNETIERLNGSIEVYSELGEGTEFVIYLPSLK